MALGTEEARSLSTKVTAGAGIGGTEERLRQRAEEKRVFTVRTSCIMPLHSLGEPCCWPARKLHPVDCQKSSFVGVKGPTERVPTVETGNTSQKVGEGDQERTLAGHWQK